MLQSATLETIYCSASSFCLPAGLIIDALCAGYSASTSRSRCSSSLALLVCRTWLDSPLCCVIYCQSLCGCKPLCIWCVFCFFFVCFCSPVGAGLFFFV